jgi:hypothetical protein
MRSGPDSSHDVVYRLWFSSETGVLKIMRRWLSLSSPVRADRNAHFEASPTIMELTFREGDHSGGIHNGGRCLTRAAQTDGQQRLHFALYGMSA